MLGALKMHKLDEKLKKCFREGEKIIERHRGLKKIKPDKELSLGHLNKAMHNFKAIEFFHKNGYSDWSASAAFYCLYHCLLGILAKKGFESRNQSCTFALIEDLINKGEIKEINSDELKEIFESDILESLEHSTKILDIREQAQYSIRTSMEDDLFNELKERTKMLFETLRKELEK